MRSVRVGIVGAAALLALHVVMLGVDLGHPHPLATVLTVDQQQVHQAPGSPDPRAGRP
jgi:hypothetical protein